MAVTTVGCVTTHQNFFPCVGGIPSPISISMLSFHILHGNDYKDLESFCVYSSFHPDSLFSKENMYIQITRDHLAQRLHNYLLVHI